MEIGFQEMLLIGIVLLFFFGPKKLPELGESIGKAIKEFKRTMHSTTSELSAHASLSQPAASTAHEPAPAESTQAQSEHAKAETTSSI